jgi:hypothetical protein
VRDDLSFLFTLADSASGRELQDEPALNTASLGSARGERPFRPLSQPVQFLPRSTVRVQVEERSFDRRGTLFIVLYGYKILTTSVCPEPMQRAVQALMQPPPIEQTVPFDYVARIELTGRPGRRSETEMPISAEGAFVATAIGYGLAPEDRRVIIDLAQVSDIADLTLRARLSAALLVANPVVPLGDLPLRTFDAAALRDGIRLRPDFVHLALAGGGLAALDVRLIDGLFETLNRPEDVSFRYSLHDTGVGTELQNQPLHNLAGLGTGRRRPAVQTTPPADATVPARDAASVGAGARRPRRTVRGPAWLQTAGHRLRAGCTGPQEARMSAVVQTPHRARERRTGGARSRSTTRCTSPLRRSMSPATCCRARCRSASRPLSSRSGSATASSPMPRPRTSAFHAW